MFLILDHFFSCTNIIFACIENRRFPTDGGHFPRTTFAGSRFFPGLFVQWTFLHNYGGRIHEGLGVSLCRSWICAVGGGRGSYGGCVLRNVVSFLLLHQSGWSLGLRQSHWTPFLLLQKGSDCWNHRWSSCKPGYSFSRLYTHVWSLSTLPMCRDAQREKINFQNKFLNK